MTLRKEAYTVEVSGDREKTVLTITCPSGIGQANVTRCETAWPKQVLLRFRLQGLEHLSLANGKDTIGTAVSSNEKPLTVRQRKDEKETAIELDDPLRLGVRVLENDGTPATKIPVKDGMIEVTLPSVFLADNPKSFKLD